MFMLVHTLGYQLPTSSLHSQSPRPLEWGEIVSHDGNFYKESIAIQWPYCTKHRMLEPGMLMIRGIHARVVYNN